MNPFIIDLNDILNTFACIKNVISTVVDKYVINKFVIIATDCYVWLEYFWNLAINTITILIIAFNTTITTDIPIFITIART
jgi:hypothetical protein